MRIPCRESCPRLARVARNALYIIAPAAIALILLLSAEGALRLAGYGYPTARFIESNSTWRDNQAFTRRFFPGPWYPDTAPVQVPVEPAQGALRVAVLGESAAYGYPDPAFGFARLLEALLEGEYPGRVIEMINAAVSGVSSPVLAESLPDVLRLKPDLLVLYIGNNEFIGPFGVSNAPDARSLTPSEIRAKVLASRLRLAQWMAALIGGPKAPSGDDTPRRGHPLGNEDPAVELTLDRFEANLRAMLSLAEAAGVPVVLCTVAVNERDWAPFADVFSTGLPAADRALWQAAWDEGAALWAENDAAAAVRAWRRAEQIDPSPASLWFALGQALDSLGDTEAATDAYTRACAQDALRYRCTPAMNDRVRRLVGAFPSEQAVLADCEKLVRQAILAAPATTAFFYDSCHLTTDGNQVVAKCIREAMGRFLPPAAAPAPGFPALLERLGWSPWHALENLKLVQRLTDKAPYNTRPDHKRWAANIEAAMASLAGVASPDALQAVRGNVEAQCKRYPNDPFLARNLAQLRFACGDNHAAAEGLDALVAAFPRFDAAWELLARARAAEKAYPQAAAAWRSACALRPERQDWRAAIGESLFLGAEYPAARIEWQALTVANPASVQAWWRLGACHEREGNLPAAIATYREALRHLPRHPGFYYYLTKALIANGDNEAARATLEEGLRSSPGDSALRELADTLIGPAK